MNGSFLFAIQRVVKQGDVLSSMLFNVGLESAFRVWRSKLCNHGFLLDGVHRLTNVRYADDIMLFAKTEQELIQMVELLVEVFQSVGLELNAAKSKILTNAPIDYSYVDVTESFVEIIDAGSFHKYLGRYISGEFIFREKTEINHRIQVG